MRHLLVSTPSDIDFEIHVVKMGLTLVYNLLMEKYATTIERDEEILSDPQIEWRKYLAVTHRITQKELLYG